MLDVTELLINRLTESTTVNRKSKKVLLEDIKYRSSVGLDRYGTRLKTHNGRDSLIDLYEELLDAYFYSMQYNLENDSITGEVLIDMVEESLNCCIDMLSTRDTSGFLKKYRPMTSSQAESGDVNNL